MHLAIAARHLRHDDDHRQTQGCEFAHELLLRPLESTVRPAHEVPDGVDLLVHSAGAMLRHQPAQSVDDGIPRRARLEALRVVDTEKAVGVAVVDQAARDRTADARRRDIATEHGVHQRGLADARLAEHREVEAAQLGEGLGQALLEHPLDLGLGEVRRAAGRPRA